MTLYPSFPQLLTAAAAALALALSAAPSGSESNRPAPTFYVSPSGNDANPGTAAKPFASLGRARDAVRALCANAADDIVVELANGTYPLSETLVFDARDSGCNGHRIVYRAETSGGATLSGARPIGNWQKDAGNRWKAAAGAAPFRQLYVDGKRATRARGTPPGDLALQGDDGYATEDAGMADWKNPADIEFVYPVVWCHTRCKVQSIRREGDRTVISMLQPPFTQARTKEGVHVELPTSIENALELLDEPGEWYLDRPGKTVYYQPLPDQDLSKARVTVPAVETLVALKGTLDRPVSNVRFEGLVFADAGWNQPSEAGLIDVQANFVVNPKKPLTRDGSLTSVHNEHLKSPANVVCRATRNVVFERCTFTRLGGAGIDVESGAQSTLISGCRFFDISGSAVQIGDVLTDDHHPDDPRKVVRNTAVVNCVIRDCCVEYRGGVGVFAGYTEGTVIAHNDISRLPYSGVSVGWGWGEEDTGGGAEGYQQPFRYDSPTPAKNISIEHNHIYSVMSSGDDGGGIYTLGNMPGTVIRGNHIHDSAGGPGGIYLDEGSGLIELTGNVIHDVKKALNFNNHAQNRLATCNEHDNDTDAEHTISERQRVIDNAGVQSAYRDLLTF